MEQKVWHKSYDSGVPAEVDFQDISLIDYLDSSTARFGDRPAVKFMNCCLSYSQLKDQVDRLATALAGMGVQKGTSVAVHLPNVPQTVISFYAIQRLGAKAVMTNPLYVPREIEHQWNDASVELAITADFLWDRHLKGMRDKLPVKNYIVTSIPDYLKFPLNLLAPLKLKKMDPPSWAKVAPEAGVHFFKKIVSSSEPNPPKVKCSMDDVAALQYTGGTTGVSKGAQLTQRNISFNVQQVRPWFTGVQEGEEVLLSCLPYFHIFGLTVCMNWPISAGACMVLMPNPRDIPMMVKNITKQKVTLFPALPALFNAVNQYPGIENQDMSSVKYCFSGSAPLPEDVQRRFESMTGAIIVEGFGLTETSPVLTVNPLQGNRKIGHIGIPVPSTEVKIVDPEDGLTEMPVGSEGELIARGPQVMKGYLNMPDETANMIRNGWIYTGDLAVMDEDGYFRICGRKKDMIIAGGYNIFPDEIDRALTDHPAVSEACTIGVPDKERGETVKSFIVFESDNTASEDELEEWCRNRLAAYKVPRGWEFRDELPKSSMMKLLRKDLRAEEEAKMKSGS
ncbi:MAG: long-chain fatty acid--CoA ligase [Planctomycetota bacterium]|jgi:long-chain acyl-CoA synthetase|nr:long-chain fatty acid--CoA ligase [Planctomycetota bacterium]